MLLAFPHSLSRKKRYGTFTEGCLIKLPTSALRSVHVLSIPQVPSYARDEEQKLHANAT